MGENEAGAYNSLKGAYEESHTQGVRAVYTFRCFGYRRKMPDLLVVESEEEIRRHIIDTLTWIVGLFRRLVEWLFIVERSLGCTP